MISRIPFPSIGRLALVGLCLALFVLLALFLLPVYLDISALKAPVETILSDIVEAPVAVETVQVDLSLWPRVRLGSIVVQGSGGEESPVFTRIDSADLEISLLALLGKELRITALGASGLDFHVHRPEHGAGNWPVWTEYRYRITEISGIELRKVTLFLDDRDIGTADAYLERLSAEIAEDLPLKLTAQGSLEGLPLRLGLAGPTLADFSPRATDFPVSVELAVSDLQLSLSGSASRQPDGTRVALELQASSAGMAFLGEKEGVVPPDLGGFDLGARLSNRDADLEITEIRGAIAGTTVEGALSLELDRPRPQISGTLALGILDLRPWNQDLVGSAAGADRNLPFDSLSAIDARIELAIETLTGIDLELRDLAGTIDLTAGDLSLPLKLRLADVPLSAELAILQTDGPPAVTAGIQTGNLDLGDLRSLGDLPANLDGSLGEMNLVASTAGRTARELIAGLSARIEARDMVLSLVGDFPAGAVTVSFERIRAEHQAEQSLSLSATGDYLGEPFQLDLETASLAALAEAPSWPVEATLRGAGARVDLHGVATRRADGLDLDLGFQAEGERVGDLSAWLGFSPESALSYHLTGDLKTRRGSHRLEIGESEIGQTQFRVGATWETGLEETPLQLDFHATSLDLRELRGMFDTIADFDFAGDTIRLDLPLLPSGLAFADADITLAVDRLVRETVDLTDLHSSLHLQPRHLERSPFSFSYGTKGFEGEIQLDLRGEVPRFELELTGSGGQLNEILEQEDLVRETRLTAEHLDIELSGEGRSIQQIVHSARLSGRLEGVRLPLSLPGFEESLELRLDSVDLSGPQGEPIVLAADGFLSDQPIQLRILLRENPREATTSLAPELTFLLQALFATNELELRGKLTLPLDARDLEGDLLIFGENLASLSPFTGRDLPALGPYRLNGRLESEEAFHALRDFDLTLGDSDLYGSLEARWKDERPSFRADLSSNRTVSADYLSGLRAPATDPMDETVAQQETAARSFSLVDLERFDASLELSIGELDTGGGSTQGIELTLQLVDGRLDLAAKPQTSDGSEARLSARIQPLEQGFEAALQARWSRQPYGLLGDVLSPGMVEGIWSVDLELGSHGASIDALLRNLRGHIDFTDYPVDFDATILDLWGGGLLTSILPVVKLGAQSRINCTVGRFLVEDGIMKPETLLVDATRSRVRGQGFIDLPNNYLRLRLKPRPKTRNLINLATPVRLQGPLTDPKVRLLTGGVTVTAFRLYLWVYTVWREVLRQPLPVDGSDICTDPEPR